MAKKGVTITFDKAWDGLIKALSPSSIKKVLNANLEAASNLNGQVAVKRIKTVLKSGKFAANKSLTVAIKKSSKPLIDKGDLFNAPEYKLLKVDTVFVGILRKNPLYDTAVTVHEGATIKVTQKMRAMFSALHLASESGDASKLKGRAAELWKRKQGAWLPLSQSTSKIKIKRRPFIERAFKSKGFHKRIQRNWHMAIKNAFRDIRQGAEK